MRIQDGRLTAASWHPTDNRWPGKLRPLYLIMHYTANLSVEETIGWFEYPQAQASAHIIIGRDGRIVQMVSFEDRAWHAGKSRWGRHKALNHYGIGIELVNAGLLTRNGGYYNWRGEEVSAEHVTEAGGQHWHDWPRVQIETAIEVAVTLYSHYRMREVLRHSDISPDRKIDPGEAYPWRSFRGVVEGRKC